MAATEIMDNGQKIYIVVSQWYIELGRAGTKRKGLPMTERWSHDPSKALEASRLADDEHVVSGKIIVDEPPATKETLQRRKFP